MGGPAGVGDQSAEKEPRDRRRAGRTRRRWLGVRRGAWGGEGEEGGDGGWVIGGLGSWWL